MNSHPQCKFLHLYQEFLCAVEPLYSPCINYMQYPWGYVLHVSHILSTHEDIQYPWVISLVSMKICITCESYHQYPWVISSVPMSHIISTHEGMQYIWVISSVPVSHIFSTHEDMQYLWVILSVPMSHILSSHEDMPYLWVISSVPVRMCSTCK